MNIKPHKMIRRYVLYIFQYNKYVRLPISVAYRIDPNCHYALRLLGTREPCYLPLVGFEGVVTSRDITCYIKGHQYACGFQENVQVM